MICPQRYICERRQQAFGGSPLTDHLGEGKLDRAVGIRLFPLSIRSPLQRRNDFKHLIPLQPKFFKLSVDVHLVRCPAYAGEVQYKAHFNWSDLATMRTR